MKQAGERAVARRRGRQRFVPHFLDALGQLTQEGAGWKRINALEMIARTDPSGGAGIQADLKTFSALGAYGCSVITALVAQNTRGVQSVYRIEPDFVAAQLDLVFSDVRIDTTKIGMLAETILLKRWQNGCNVIRSKTWYSTPLCWQKAATRCFHLRWLRTLRA